MKWVFKFLLVLMVSTAGFASGAKANCTISIKSYKKTGESLNIVFHTTLRTQSECRTLATMHKQNFTPETVRTKDVNFAWSGVRENTKRKGMVARITKKSFRKKNTY